MPPTEPQQTYKAHLRIPTEYHALQSICWPNFHIEMSNAFILSLLYCMCMQNLNVHALQAEGSTSREESLALAWLFNSLCGMQKHVSQQPRVSNHTVSTPLEGDIIYLATCGQLV